MIFCSKQDNIYIYIHIHIKKIHIYIYIIIDGNRSIYINWRDSHTHVFIHMNHDGFFAHYDLRNPHNICNVILQLR